MSSLKLYNTDTAPLKLDHDPRPRDTETEKLIMERPLYRKDFRYHGYPEESFFQPKRSHKRPLSDEEKMKKRISDSNLFDQNNSRKRRDDFQNKRPLYEPGPSYRYSSQPHHPSPPQHHQLPSSTNKPADRMTDIDFHVQNPPQITAKNNFMEKRPYEVEKLRREKQEAEEDIARYKAEQKRKSEEAEAEKKKEYERSTRFYFWDAHNLGHGAPKGYGDNRKQKFTEEETTPRDQQGYSNSQDTHRSLLYSPKPRRAKFMGGAGAPMQTDSGSIETHIHMNPSIHFQDQENIPPALNQQLKINQLDRQKNSYGKELLQQSQEKELLNQELKIQELKKEIEMLKGNDPYGKPGGSAPNKSQSDPFIDRKENHYLDVSDVGSHKSPRRRYIEDESGDPYFPFGRPGAGAPIRDVDGNVITGMKNQVERNTSSAEERKKARAARAYFEELQQEEKEQKLVRQELERHHKAPIGEFASIIKEGQVGKPRRDPVTGVLLNQHLGISDISKFKMNHQYKDEDEMRLYHDDLSRQADDRHRMRELNRLKEKQLSKQHYDVMGDYWGRYGGGAPKDPNVRKKAALNETLYSPGRTQIPQRVSEIHEAPKERVLPQYVRSIVPSTHINKYDYSDQGREKRYGPPYATSD